MEYITAAEAAEKWGVTPRQACRFLVANRIPHAKRYHRSWLVPADAQKPGDPRREKREKKHPPQKSLSSELAELIEASTGAGPYAKPLPWDNPDVTATTISDEPFRLFVEGWLAYLRGDFEQTKQNFRGIRNEAVKLWACSLAVAAAISTGDYPLYQEIEAYCKDKISANLGANVTTVAEWALTTASVGAFVPSMIPDWLKDGDFSAIPAPLKQEAIYKRAQYFWFTKKYQSTLDVAQTGLAFYEREHGMAHMGIYLRCTCAAACSSLGRRDDAKKYLLDLMRDCLPNGFITPFAENAVQYHGLLEQCLEQEFPSYYDAVTGQARRTIPNWLDFHNRFTKDHIPLILSLREYQMAQLAAQGVPFKKIAEQYHISLGTLNNSMQIIYQKLSINSKKQLSQYVL